MDLGHHVADRLPGSSVAQDYPKQRELDPEEDDDRDHRDAGVRVVDVFAVGRRRVREDGAETADIARAEDEGEPSQARDCDERASATNHEVEVYRRLDLRPGVPDQPTG